MQYLITSALPYINGIKHLGNLVGSLLSADVYTRFLRQEGHEVLYICGTDEHGTPAEIASKEAGQAVADYCQDMYKRQLASYEAFQIEFDYFGRTSSAQHARFTQEVFRDLYEQGFILQKETQQLYSVDDGRYLPDRYVVGTCPQCAYEKARGDQCDGCGSLLDPLDLKNPRSAISGSTNIEVRPEKHLYLDLIKLQDVLVEWLDSKQHWLPLVKGIAQAWIKEGLRERCITRDLDWGVPVPLPGFEKKVFYVWFDAPLGYISFTQEYFVRQGKGDGDESWRSWWQQPSPAKLVQFMAKDNVPFHAVFWPAMMLGTKRPWVMADYIKGFSWLNYEGGKFSTSQRRGVFADQALALYPADYWRYSLVAMAPESADANFTFRDFADTVNKDLADKLGNFVVRTIKFSISRLSSRVGPLAGLHDKALSESVSKIVDQYVGVMENLRLREAIKWLRGLWECSNTFFSEKEPWKTVKVDKEAAARVVDDCLCLIYFAAILSQPFIPATSERIMRALGMDVGRGAYPLQGIREVLAGRGALQFSISDPGILFAKIEAEDVQKLEVRFSGQEPSKG